MKRKISLLISLVFLINIFFANIIPSSSYAYAAEIRPEASFGGGNTGNIRVVEFDVTAQAENMEAIIGLADSSQTPASAEEFPVAVRLNREGTIDVVNGDAFSSMESVTYAVYEKIHVKTMINLPAKTYDVWVTPSGGAPVPVAKDYSFAYGAPLMDDIGGLYSVSYC